MNFPVCVFAAICWCRVRCSVRCTDRLSGAIGQIKRTCLATACKQGGGQQGGNDRQRCGAVHALDDSRSGGVAVAQSQPTCADTPGGPQADRAIDAQQHSGPDAQQHDRP